jgi:hypothetical protein
VPGGEDQGAVEESDLPVGIVDERTESASKAALGHALRVGDSNADALGLQVIWGAHSPHQRDEGRRARPRAPPLCRGHLVGGSLQSALQRLLPAGRQLPATSAHRVTQHSLHGTIHDVTRQPVPGGHGGGAEG